MKSILLRLCAALVLILVCGALLLLMISRPSAPSALADFALPIIPVLIGIGIAVIVQMFFPHDIKSYRPAKKFALGAAASLVLIVFIMGAFLGIAVLLNYLL